jgi:hypothetical protein
MLAYLPQTDLKRKPMVQAPACSHPPPPPTLTLEPQKKDTQKKKKKE